MTDKEKEQVKEFSSEVEKDIKKGRLHWETFASFAALIFIVAGIAFGAWWYLGNQEVNDDIESKLNYKKGTSSDVSDEETSSWKTYTSVKYGFSIKYPGTWTVVENATSDTSGSGYVGSNVFSPNNVVFDNKVGQYAISISVDSIIGRGGTCVKRNIIYTSNIASNKLVLTGKTDTDNSLSSGENLMCDISSLRGYAIATTPASGTGYQTQGGHDYFFHSESTTVADATVNEVVEYFEKMMATMTWK